MVKEQPMLETILQRRLGLKPLKVEPPPTKPFLSCSSEEELAIAGEYKY
jgi:hypothetical protein